LDRPAFDVPALKRACDHAVTKRSLESGVQATAAYRILVRLQNATDLVALDSNEPDGNELAGRMLPVVVGMLLPCRDHQDVAEGRIPPGLEAKQDGAASAAFRAPILPAPFPGQRGQVRRRAQDGYRRGIAAARGAHEQGRGGRNP
jgi:hypothetical protein